jgi:hypothetical protein
MAAFSPPQLDVKSRFLTMLATSDLLANAIPDVRRRALVETAIAASGEEDVVQVKQLRPSAAADAGPLSLSLSVV